METAREEEKETNDQLESGEPEESIVPQEPDGPIETGGQGEPTKGAEPELKLPDWITPDPGAGDKGRLLYVEDWGLKGRHRKTPLVSPLMREPSGL